jgi:hypothetical protein
MKRGGARLLRQGKQARMPEPLNFGSKSGKIEGVFVGEDRRCAGVAASGGAWEAAALVHVSALSSVY